MQRANRLSASAVRDGLHQSASDTTLGRRLRRAFVWLVYAIAFFCVLSTVAHICDLRADYFSRPFYRDYDALQRWTLRARPTATASGATPARVALQTRPWMSTSWSPTTSALRSTVRPPRYTQYARWPFELREVHCPTTSMIGAGAQVPVVATLFIHGNAGDARQGDYWSCAMALRHRLSEASAVDAGERTHLRLFTVAMAEQANVHRGALVRRQADFVADAVMHVHALVAEVREMMLVSDGTTEDPSRAPPVRVWLVGHSMGGIVAHLSAAMLLHDRSPLPSDPLLRPRLVEGVLTVNTPHQHPPLFMDASMSELYAALRAADAGLVDDAAQAASGPIDSETWVRSVLSARPGNHRAAVNTSAARAPPLRLVSLTSGAHDLQIASSTTALHGLRAPLTPRTAAALPAAPARLWLDGSAWCGGSRSHDGALLNPCLQALAAAVLLEPRPSAWLALADADARVEPRPWYSAWGRLSGAWQLWPVTACVLSLYLLRTALLSLHPSDGGAASTTELGRVAPGVVCVFLAGRAVGLLLRGPGLALASAWSWDAPPLRHVDWLHVGLPLPLASIGQIAVGLVLGKWCAALVRGLVALGVLIAPGCGGAGIGRTSSRRRGTHALLAVALAHILFVCADVGGLAVRAVGLLLLCLVHTACQCRVNVSPEAALARPTQELSTPTTSTIIAVEQESHSSHDTPPATALLGPSTSSGVVTPVRVGFALSLYAALLLIHVQPFFALRNALLSRTRDSRDLADWFFSLVELSLCAALVLCVWASRPCESREGSSVRRRRGGGWRMRISQLVSGRAPGWLALWFAQCGMLLCAACVLDSWRALAAVGCAIPAMLLAVLVPVQGATEMSTRSAAHLV